MAALPVMPMEPRTASMMEAAMHIASLSKVAETLIRSSLKSKDLNSILIVVNTFSYDIALTADCAGWSFEMISNVGNGRSDLDFIWRLFDVEIESTSTTVNGRLTCLRSSSESKVNIHYSNRPLGHRIAVSNIFERLHVRRLSLNLSKELGKIQTIAEALLMLHHEIAFHLSTDSVSDKIFSIPKHNSVIDRYSYFHREIEFKRVTLSTKYLTMKGYVALAETQIGASGQFAYIDGQFNESLTHSLDRAIRKYMISGNMMVSGSYPRNGIPFVLSVHGQRGSSELTSDDIMDLTVSLMKHLNTMRGSRQKTDSSLPLSHLLKPSPQAAELNCFDIETPSPVKVDSSGPNRSQIDSPEAVLSLTVSRSVTPIVAYFDHMLLQDSDNDLRPKSSSYEDDEPWHEEAAYEDAGVELAVGDVITGLNLESGDFDAPAAEYNSDLLDNDFLPSSKYSSKVSTSGPLSEISVDKRCFQSFTCIGQFAHSFILGTGSDGTLLCVDQHAADERVQLERIAHGESLEIASIEIKENLELRHAEVLLLRQHENTLLRWGFRWNTQGIATASGSTRLTLLKVPVICEEPLTSIDFLDFLAYLKSNPGLPAEVIRPPALLRIHASKACRTAVMFGDPLTVKQGEDILTSLAETSLPFQCAHGRPTMTPMADIHDLHSSRARKLKNHPIYKHIEFS